MKKLLLPALLLLSSSAFSQLKSSMGFITDEEAKLKECPFDKEAAAVVLMDEGHTDYDVDYDMITSIYRKIKILKESGLKHGEVTLDYHSGKGIEDIYGIEIMVSNFDENGRIKQISVERKSIFRKKVNENWSRITVAVPELKKGSIVEVKYTHKAESYAYIKDWYFQEEIPVYKSMYNLKMVPTLEMTYLLQHDPRYQLVVKPQKLTSSVYFEMQNIPGLAEEPFMDAREDYVQKVIFQVTKYSTSFGSQNHMSTWDEVTKDLLNRAEFGKQLRVNIPEANVLLDSLSGKSDTEKMKAIHAYVRSADMWNGTNRVITNDGVKELWKTKSGNSAAVNLSLVNLLQKAGLTAHPMLVSERGHGKINKGTPFVDQFNNVYAAVKINGKQYFLDATNKYTPVHLTPYEILNSTGFIVSEKHGGLVDIGEPESRYHDIVFNKAVLKDDGSYSGSVNLWSKDYARRSWVGAYKTDEREAYINKHILDGMANITIDSLEVENADKDTLAFKQKFNYNTAIQSTGEYSFINLNMFTGYEKNPFLQSNRFSRVNFGYRQTVNLTCDVQLPDTYQVDALPGNIKMKNQEGSVVFTREVFYDEKTSRLVARMKIDINRALFDVDEYSSLQEFYKKMIDLLNEQVVLKRK